MKKYILISIILSVLLVISNVSEAGVTKKERANFDYHLKSIEKRNKSYQSRKNALWKSEQRQRRERTKKAKAKKRNENILRKNRESARKYQIKTTLERRKSAKPGTCFVDEIIGDIVCR